MKKFIYLIVLLSFHPTYSMLKSLPFTSYTMQRTMSENDLVNYEEQNKRFPGILNYKPYKKINNGSTHCPGIIEEDESYEYQEEKIRFFVISQASKTFCNTNKVEKNKDSKPKKLPKIKKRKRNTPPKNKLKRTENNLQEIIRAEEVRKIRNKAAANITDEKKLSESVKQLLLLECNIS